MPRKQKGLTNPRLTADNRDVRLLRPDHLLPCSGALSVRPFARGSTMRLLHSCSYRRVIEAAFLLCFISSLSLATTSTTATTRPKRRAPAHHVAATSHAAGVRHAVPHLAATPGAPVIAGGPWDRPTFADSTEGDRVDGEDLTVRRAAVEALGSYNGSVVALDPTSGRILTMVNQRIALGEGFQPCSTIKVAVALAGLSEKIIQPNARYRLGGMRMDLTYALAHSNNYYFATLGEKLGFDKVTYYAHLFGYGERAGLNISGEQPGYFPPAPPKNGGVGMLTSFGEEIRQTPLQLAALMAAVSNGGTLYYLQYPQTEAEVRSFVPRVKRRLDIDALIPMVKPGMRGAVEFGTAHRAREDGPIAGKTGTCSETHTHLGWFGSFNEIGGKKTGGGGAAHGRASRDRPARCRHRRRCL